MGDALNLAGRGLIALLFLGGAVQKLGDPAPVQAMLAGVGLPPALVWPVALFNLVAGIALLVAGAGLTTVLGRAACGGLGRGAGGLLPDDQLFPLAAAGRPVAGDDHGQELGHCGRADDLGRAGAGALGDLALGAQAHKDPAACAHCRDGPGTLGFGATRANQNGK